MKTILLINLIIGYVTLFGVLLIGGSMMTLNYFPTSKLSSFIRKHFLTDEDLEPTKRQPLEKGLLEDDILEPPLKD